MNKCDFCAESRLKEGILICPFNRCILTKSECLDIARALAPKITTISHDQNQNSENS